MAVAGHALSAARSSIERNFSSGDCRSKPSDDAELSYMRFTVDRCEVFDACEPLAPGSSPDLAALAVASPMMPIERGIAASLFRPIGLSALSKIEFRSYCRERSPQVQSSD